MADLVKFLVFDGAGETLKWMGSTEELRSFGNCTLGVDEMEYGEIVQNKIHNAITYKIHDVNVRFYTTTRTLKLHGPNSDLLKQNFLKLLNAPNGGKPSKPDYGDDELADESSSASTLIGNTVSKGTCCDHISLRKELDEIRLALDDLTNHVYSGDMQMQTSRSISHRDKINILQNENHELAVTIKN